MSFFSDLFGTGGDASKAAGQKIAGLQAADTAAGKQYDAARGALTSGYGQAQNILTPSYNLGQSGSQAYADITGANGAVGQDRARALFQTDPGYEFALAQGLQATDRTRGTGGFQGSGNVLAALTDYGVGAASKQYSDYVNRLAPFLGYGATTGGQLAGAYTGEGQALGATDISQGQLQYGTQAGIGSAEAAGTLGDAAARQAGINNILKIGGAALGAFTGGGGGSLANSLLGFTGGGGNAVSNSDPYRLGNYNYNFGF